MSFRSAFYRFIARYSKVPAVTHKTMLSAWHTDVYNMQTLQVDRIELCTASTCGKNEWGDDVEDFDLHTFLQLHLEPTADGPQAILIERMISSEGIYHSLFSLQDYLIPHLGGTLRRPDILDRVYVIRAGSVSSLLRNFSIERSLPFHGDLTIQELSTILDFVSSMTKGSHAGHDCEYLSRSFAFNCLAALAPTIPPPFPDAHPAFEVIFEAGAARLMERLPRMIPVDADPESMIALRLIRARREEKITADR